MKTILVPLDFSRTSIHAFRFAIDLAAKSRERVYVLHVIDLPLKQIEKESRKKFEAVHKKYGKKSVLVKFFVEVGPIVSTIHQFIDKHKLSIAIMGTHGVSGMKEFFVGSNTEKIVRSSRVPVWAIRKYVKISTMKDIVLPTYVNLEENKFIEKIKELQLFFKAKLHLLYVNTSDRFMRDIDIMQNLRVYKEFYRLTNVTLNIRGDFSEPDGIIHFTHEIKGDMIAMSTHGRKGLSHWLSGSVAEDVVNHVHCPIFTYHSKA
jgi:nucleotide-binding universal stress UspA family protein